MKIENKILKHVLIGMLTEKQLDESGLDLSTDEGVQRAYKMAEECEGVFEDTELIDDLDEFRCSGEAVDIKGLKAERSRHYEVDRVATKILDGIFVSWLYWYGGGKHAEPEGIDWMYSESGAVEVNCKEEEKLVTVRTYSKK